MNTTFTPTNTINYTKASASVSINVTPATPTITWIIQLHNIWNTIERHSARCNCFSTRNFCLHSTSGTELDVGLNQTLNTIFTPTDTVDYTTASSVALINVTKVTPTIIWSNPATITYGTALNSTQLDATVSVP